MSQSLSSSSPQIGYFRWGKAFFELNKYSEAIAKFDKVIALDDRHADAYYHKGLTLYKQGKYPEAIEQFDKVTSINHKHVNAYYYCGMAYLNLHWYPKSIFKFYRVTKVADKEEQKNKIADAHYYIARCYKSLINLRCKADKKKLIKIIRNGKAYCEKAISFNPNHHEAKKLLEELNKIQF